MTGVAVIAHQKKQLGGGLDELRPTLADAGVDDPLWFEVPKSKKAPEARRAGASRAAPTSCSCGAATAWCSAASTRWPAPASTLAIIPAGTANLLADEPRRSRRTSREAVADRARTATGARSTSESINGEHFAVMAGAGLRRVDDPRRRRRAEGPGRSRSPTSAPARSATCTCEPIGMRIEVDGEVVRRARRAACSSATSARSWAASPRSPTPGPTTDARDRRRHRQGTGGSGRGTLARMAAEPARARRRSSRRTRGRTVDIRLDRKMPYELDGGDRKPTQAAEGEGRAGGDHGLRSRASEPIVSTATLVPETWELTGDDAVETLRDAAGAGCSRTPSCACGSPTASATPGRSRSRRRSCSCRGSSRWSASRPRSATAASADVIVRAIQDAVPGPAGDAADRGGRPGPPRRRLAPVPRPRLRARSARSSGDHAHGPARARPEPPLRRRAGPADAAEVRPGVRARRHRGDLGALARSRCWPSAQSIGESLDNDSLSTGRGTSCAGRSALLLMMAAIALLFRWSPAPAPAGAGRGWRSAPRSSVGLLARRDRSAWRCSSASSTSFGDTYGPLAGIVALLLWSLLSAVAVLFGAAVAAQLEAVRAGAAQAAGRREGRALRARRSPAAGGRRPS